MAKAAYEGGKLSVFKDILLQNIPDHAVSVKSIGQAEMLAQIKTFDTCRSGIRQGGLSGGLERCLYFLCKNAPCFSPKFKGFFVYNEKTALLTFERLSQQGEEVALFLDAHSIAFFLTHNPSLMEKVIYDLNAPDKNKKIVGNLRFMAILQNRSKVSSVPAMAKVFLSALPGVYKVFNNTKLRKQVEEGVKHEAEEGNLVGMSALIDNPNARRKDQKTFELAKREYKLLQDEYNQYNLKLANKRTYGVVNGRDAAAIVSWTVATGITLLSVFAFLSGYRIF